MSMKNTYMQVGQSFHELPDAKKVAILLVVYGAIAVALVHGLGLEGTSGGFTGIGEVPR